MALRFNPPPNWPTPPAGFIPDENWQPDPAWGPAPDGWEFWVEDGQDDAVQPVTEPAAEEEPAEQPVEAPVVQEAPAAVSAAVADAPAVADKSEPTPKSLYILGISLMAFLALCLIAVLIIANFLAPKESENSAAETSRSASSSASVTPSLSPLDRTPSATPTEETISKEEAQEIYNNAKDIPAADSFPADTFKTYSSKTEKAGTGENQNFDYYQLSPERIGTTKDIAWAELKVTPATTESGTFKNTWDPRLSSEPAGKTTFSNTYGLTWDKAGEEQQFSFWLSSREQDAKEEIYIEVPKGSTWTLTVHPADHAPLLSGPVRSQTAQAFRYDMQKSKTNALRFTSLGVNDKRHNAFVEIASRKYAQSTSADLRFMTAYKDGWPSEAFQDYYRLETDSGLGGISYISVNSRNAQWVLEESSDAVIPR